MTNNINATRMRIYPAQAKKMLERARPNRKLRNSRVDRIKNDIITGNWRITGETIIFDDDGYLVDGQHRLWACVSAGLPIDTYIVTGGIDPDSMSYIDTGAARTPGDALAMLGRSDANHLAATCRWIHRYRTNAMRYELTHLPRPALIEIIEKYPTIANSLQQGHRMKKLLLPSLGAALHWLMAQADQPLADKYFHELAYGAPVNTLPSAVVREVLLSNLMHRAKLRPYHLAAIVIKGWNHTYNNRKVKMIRWYPDSPTKPEVFPMIEGYK